ncbi:MAG: hypothetical protein QX196_10220 [Methylococcaceae bacterium]
MLSEQRRLPDDLIAKGHESAVVQNIIIKSATNLRRDTEQQNDSPSNKKS